MVTTLRFNPFAVGEQCAMERNWEHYLASGSYDGSVKVWDGRLNVVRPTIECAHGGSECCV